VPERLAANAEVRKLLDDTGLTADLEQAGIEVARLMLELFADEPPDSPLFAEYSFISPEDLDDSARCCAASTTRGGARCRREHTRCCCRCR